MSITDLVGTPARATTTQLHAAAMAGSESAWLAIVERYNRLLWSVVRAFRLDTAEAEDVVQLTWVKLVERLGQVRDPERLGGWLATTARNEALAVLRRCRREAPIGAAGDFETLAAWADPDLVVAADERSTLVRAFGRLDEEDQRLLVLLIADPPLSYAEIAAVVGRPVGAIGPSRGRALERLRRAFSAEELRRTSSVVAS
ncbi:MAG TPA: sigma-70 family RNA polymerase sigma factor [Acidimicrobiia bacterium]|jgi:RNA polymerase sigma factor (sigma-70 family)|nr:sigma-70 family RNA polymerase sigma factor [Acidimicrobiia bacterium]